MHATPPRDGPREEGAALVLAVLVITLLTLLGVSYLMMADTESRIAENERLAAQVLYVGESGVRMVKRWFDTPGSAANLVNPPIAAIDRTLRRIDADGDPSTDPVPQDGSTWPMYKQGVDLDADGEDDVFDRPYRSSLRDTLLGTESGPDVRIDGSASEAARTFLSDLSDALLGGFPAGGAGIRARIARIDVYAPPYVRVGGAWNRYGVATAAVTARISRTSGPSEIVLAEKVVRAVLNETPFPGPFGPLHSCAELRYDGNFSPHWGTVTAVGDLDLPNALDVKVDDSIPRGIPTAPRVDTMWGSDLTTSPNWADYAASVGASGLAIEDPWLRILTAGDFLEPTGHPRGGGQQPLPFSWSPPHPAPLADADDHSNLFQNLPLVRCPDFDYETWKSIATSGGENVHYYTWANGSSFQENGIGPALTFESVTDGRAGLFFFDTKDRRPPRDDDGDGVFDNLTPAIRIAGSTWGARGFLYLNAEQFQTRGVTGRAATFRAPGEPYLDANANAVRDDGEPYLNLEYPDALGGTFRATDVDDGYDGAGPAVEDEAAIWGILYTNGYYDATGNAKYFGSVITKQGVIASPAAGTPDLYWDESIVENWPPPEWDLPRVFITRWETDP